MAKLMVQGEINRIGTVWTAFYPPRYWIPKDLRHWLDEETLVHAALEAVASVPADSNLPSQFQGYPVATLLTLLTYCYGIGVYGSREIELLIQKDKTTRYLCAYRYPDWNALRLFRRRHQDLVKETLYQFLKKAWEIRCKQHPNSESPEETHHSQALLCGDVEEKLYRNLSFAMEAERRLNQALQLDSMELDD